MVEKESEKKQVRFSRVLILCLLGLASTHGQSQWEWRQPAQGSDLFEIVKGNGIWIAIGSNTISVSPDCKAWKSSLVNGAAFSDIAFGAGKFIITGAGGELRVSADGARWTSGRLPDSSVGTKIKFGNGKFVAVGKVKTGLYSFTSTDGLAWTSKNLNISKGLGSYAFGNGLFAFMASNALDPWCYASTDGINWQGTPMGNMNVSMKFVHDRFAFNFRYDQIDDWFYSLDAVNLVHLTPRDHYYFDDFGYMNGTFSLYGNTGVMSTSDFTTWTETRVTYNPQIFKVYSDTSRVVAIQRGGQISASPDGIQFSVQSPGVLLPDIRKIIHADGKYFALSQYGGLLSSPDAKTWSLAPALLGRGGESFNDLGHFNGTFLAVGDQGGILVSRNGVDWVKYPSPVSNDLHTVAYQDSFFIIHGPPTLYSRDAMSWKAATHTFAPTSVINVNGRCLINLKPAVTGPEGLKWENLAYNSPLGGIQSVAFGNGRYVGVGNNVVATSVDLEEWTLVDTTTPLIFGDIVFANNQFVAISSEQFRGFNNSIVTSPDGTKWTKLKPGGPGRLISLTHGDDQFLVAGEDGGIMASYFDDPNSVARPEARRKSGKKISIAYEKGGVHILSEAFGAVRIDGRRLHPSPALGSAPARGPETTKR